MKIIKNNMGVYIVDIIKPIHNFKAHWLPIQLLTTKDSISAVLFFTLQLGILFMYLFKHFHICLIAHLILLLTLVAFHLSAYNTHRRCVCPEHNHIAACTFRALPPFSASKYGKVVVMVNKRRHNGKSVLKQNNVTLTLFCHCISVCSELQNHQ